MHKELYLLYRNMFTVGCEQALVQASGMPDTQDLLSTNSHANQYEPCIRHEDEKSESSEWPMKPSITGFSTEKAIGTYQVII